MDQEDGRADDPFSIVVTVHAARLKNGKLRREPFLTPLLWTRVLAVGWPECDALIRAYGGIRGIRALTEAAGSTHHQPVPTGFFDPDRVFTHPPRANGKPIAARSAWGILKAAKQVREMTVDFEEVTVFVGSMPDG